VSKTPDKLFFLQAVRERPAMYIGSTSIRGFYLLLRQLVRYGLNEAHSDDFTFEILDPRSGRISFKTQDGPINEKVFFDPERKGFSGRSVDYELAALNAICSYFHVVQTSLQTGESSDLRFAMGFQAVATRKTLGSGPHRVEIEFKLDEAVFAEREQLQWNLLLEALRTLAYLYRGKTICLVYEMNGRSGNAVFRYVGGLSDLIGCQRLYEHAEPVFVTALEHDFGEFSLDIALHFRGTSVDTPYLVSFVNEERSMEDGTHVEAVLKGLFAALVHFQSESTSSSHHKLTMKGVAKLLVAAVHLRMEKPMFEGAIKGRVVSKSIVGPISNHVGEVFLARLRAEPEQADDLVSVVARLSSH
jgi:DNA gyrase subunit B